MPEMSFTSALTEACMGIRIDQISLLKKTSLLERRVVELSKEKIVELSGRIGSLPQACRDVLVARYSYDMSAEEIENLYRIDDPRGECLYAEKLLGYAWGLSDEEIISPKQLAEACNAADLRLAAEIKEVGAQPALSSKKHERKMRDILKRDGKRSKLLMLFRIVAAFLLTLLIGGTVALSVSAEFREMFFGWVVTTYPTFSAIGDREYNPAPDAGAAMGQPVLDRSREIEMHEYARYAPTFIPEGYALSMTTHSWLGGSSRNYSNADERWITVGVRESDGVALYDTEDTELTTIELFGEEAFVWQRRGITFVVFTYDGLHCDVMADGLDIDTALEVARSLTKYDSMELANADKPKTPGFVKLESMLPSYVPDFVSINYIDISDPWGTELQFIDTYEHLYHIHASPIPEDEMASDRDIFQWQGTDFYSWDYEGYRFLLEGQIDDEEMMKMAESMRPAK
jgi:hypothetical protein